MAHLLGGERLRLEYPTRVVFDEVTVGIAEGDRIGVVGRNGDGKSSLLRLLAGRQEPDAGRVTRRGGLTLGILDQSDALPEASNVGRIVIGDRAEHEWAGEARIRDVLGGLLHGIPLEAAVDSLSGGERRRVALAALLSRDWDVILLDEPTNHLDIEGVDWLARHLRTRWPAHRGGLAVVTHDRWFLDAVSTTTWEVHDRVVEPFEGGYAAYILQRVERDRQSAASEARRQNLARKELAWLRRGAPARTSKPKFRIDAATQLIEDVPPPRDSVALQRLAVGRLGKDVVDLLDAGVDFGGVPVLRDVEWRIAPGERTGILGRNGAGKSTLLGLVSGAIEPTAGRVKRGKTVRFGVLDQRLAELEDIAEDRVSDVLGRRRTSYAVGDAELTPGQLLERLGFPGAQLSSRVRELSGGQRRRLQLLLVLLEEPNVLILDEPTNDLDTDMLAAMEDLLDSWPGTLLVVSHDRYLIERVTDQQYAVLGGEDGVGRMRHLPGGVDEYLRLATEPPSADPGRPPESRAVRAAPSGASAALSEAPAALSGAARRAAEKELAALERRLAKQGVRIAQAHGEFATVDQSDHALLGRMHAELAALDREKLELEERWIALSEELEA